MDRFIVGLYARLYELRRDEQGQDLVEYALLLAVLALVVIASITPLTDSVIKLLGGPGGPIPH